MITAFEIKLFFTDHCESPITKNAVTREIKNQIQTR